MSENEQNTRNENEPEQPKRRADNYKKPMDNLKAYAGKLTKGNRVFGIIIAIIMIIVGVLLFIRPLAMTLVLEYLAGIGVIIYGAYQIIAFITAPKEARNGWTVASGIIWVLLGLLLLFGRPLATLETFAFIFGFMTLFTGITRLSVAGEVKKAGGPWGWVIASGIINIILSVFFLLTPFAMSWVVGLVSGIYLTIGGMMLLVDSCSKRPIA